MLVEKIWVFQSGLWSLLWLKDVYHTDSEMSSYGGLLFLASWCRERASLFTFFKVFILKLYSQNVKSTLTEQLHFWSPFMTRSWQYFILSNITVDLHSWNQNGILQYRMAKTLTCALLLFLYQFSDFFILFYSASDSLHLSNLLFLKQK